MNGWLSSANGRLTVPEMVRYVGVTDTIAMLGAVAIGLVGLLTVAAWLWW